MAAIESYTFSPSNREDLANVIFNIDPTETPFVSACERGVSTQKKHEWLVDELVAETININVEGADYTSSYDTRPDPDRLHSYTQIWAKNLSVSGTQEATDKAGRKSELAYQMAKMGLEIRRDMEYQFLSGISGTEAGFYVSGVDGGSSPLQAGSSTVARVTGSVATWIDTNVDKEATGVNAARVGGTQQPADDDEAESGLARAFLESQLKAGIRNSWNEGGNPTYLVVDPFNKQAVSAMTGGATRFDQSEDKRLVTAVDIYVSDFGEHMVIPDRFNKQNGTTATDGTNAFLLDMSKWSIDWLRPFYTKELATIGDAENRLLIGEGALCSKNESASAIVRDLLDA